MGRNACKPYHLELLPSQFELGRNHDIAFGELYVVDLYDQELILGSDGNAIAVTETLNRENVVRATALFNARVSHGVYENIHNIRGGNGFFRRSVQKLLTKDAPTLNGECKT